MAPNTSKHNHLAVVLPAYNEGAVIGDVLEKIPKSRVIGGEKYKISVIVVNDGSTDDTADQTRLKDAYLVNHILNSGAGAATRTGLNVAKMLGCDFAVTMDSDGQHAIEDVLNVADAVVEGKADFVIGSRLVNTIGMPWYRVIGNKGLSFITFIIFGVFVTDSQSGLKALNKKALSRINFHSNDFAFCSEMLWHAKKAGLVIKEVPIKAIYTDYSLTKGQSNWGAVGIIRQLILRRLVGIING